MSDGDIAVYVGGLSYQADEDDLRDTFKKYGTLTTVKVVYDRESGKSRGFGFVHFDNKDDAQSAIDALHGQDIKGRDIKCSLARPRGEGGSGRGGGYSAGGRGGGGYGGGRGGGGYGGGRGGGESGYGRSYGGGRGNDSNYDGSGYGGGRGGGGGGGYGGQRGYGGGGYGGGNGGY